MNSNSLEKPAVDSLDTAVPSGVRDNLALIRTDLANERTLLAYGRTGLMVFASGVTLIKFFGDSPALVVVGWAFSAIGVTIGALGIHRFTRLNRRLH